MKTQTTVRTHTAKSKKGKLSAVKQHVRKLTPKQMAKKKARLERKMQIKAKIGEFKSASFGRAVEAARAFMRAKSPDEGKALRQQFSQREKLETAKFVAKHLPSKTPTRMLKRTNRIHGRLGKMHERIFGKAEKLRSRLEAKGKLYQGEGHPVNQLKKGTRIKFASQEGLYNKWKVTKIYNDEGGVRKMILQNTGIKSVQRVHPIAQLASWYDRGMFSIRDSSKKKKPMSAEVKHMKQLPKKIEQGKRPLVNDEESRAAYRRKKAGLKEPKMIHTREDAVVRGTSKDHPSLKSKKTNLPEIDSPEYKKRVKHGKAMSEGRAPYKPGSIKHYLNENPADRRKKETKEKQGKTLKQYQKKYGDDLGAYSSEEFREEFGHAMPAGLKKLLSKPSKKK